VVSPEILPDNHVAVRVFAPKASEVVLRGDWMKGFTTERLTKDKKGVWSVTVGPLTPDYYSYMLFVDHAKTLDPQDPEVRQGMRGIVGISCNRKRRHSSLGHLGGQPSTKGAPGRIPETRSSEPGNCFLSASRMRQRFGLRAPQ
jgi:hypothetical protein